MYEFQISVCSEKFFLSQLTTNKCQFVLVLVVVGWFQNTNQNQQGFGKRTVCFSYMLESSNAVLPAGNQVHMPRAPSVRAPPMHGDVVLQH